MKLIYLLFLLFSLILSKSKKNHPYTLKTPSNSYFQALSSHDLDYQRPCDLKQGFLGSITQIHNKTIYIKPIFLVLNPKYLSLFQNESLTSLIRSIELQAIQTPEKPSEWGNLLCFKLPINPKPSTKHSNIRNYEGFCGLDEQSLESWKKAIIQFKNCSLESLPIKQKITKSKPQNPNFYDETLLKDDLDNELAKLKRDVIRDRLQEEKERFHLENERKKIQKKTRKLEKQQKVLSRALQAKALEEEKIAEALIKQEEGYKRNLILEQTRKALINETHKEKSMLIRQEEQLLNAEKGLQEQIKTMMVQSSYDFEKFLDYKGCYKKELTGGNITYIKEICYQITESNIKGTNAEGIVACLDKTRFCEQCCGFFIGTSHGTERFKCKKQCENVILPQFNIKTDSAYIVTLPKQNVILPTNFNGTSLLNITNTNKNMNNSIGVVLDVNNKVERENKGGFNSINGKL